MTPRLEACHFGSGDGSWTRLALVLEHSASLHCPAWERTVACIRPIPLTSAIQKAIHVSNAQKTAYWCDRVQEAPDGTPMLLLDVDTAILRPLDDIWDRPFDFAYTIRENYPTPFNAGVIFLRVSEPVRTFFLAWRDRTQAMLSEKGFIVSSWRGKYRGIAQGALGPLLKTPHGLQVVKLTCREWNCEDSAWAAYDPQATRILHVKSTLRKAVFGTIATSKELRPVVARWRELEAEMELQRRVHAEAS